MSERLWRQHSIAGLRNMLGGFRIEHQRLQDEDPVKAAHLADAIEDLLGVIEELEDESYAEMTPVFSDRRAYAPRQREVAYDHPIQSRSTHPRQAAAHLGRLTKRRT
jgi:hypothetical protein